MSEHSELDPNDRYAADIALIDLVVGGDRLPWEQFATQHELTLRFALIRTMARFGLTPTAEQLEDLEADLSLNLVAQNFRRLAKYSGRCSLRQWLKVVAGNFAVDHLRRQRPVISLDLEGPGHSAADSLVDESPGPDELIERRELQESIENLLAQLNDEDRLFVELFYARGHSYESVAELMGTTLGAVYARRNRIRKRLTSLAEQAQLL